MYFKYIDNILNNSYQWIIQIAIFLFPVTYLFTQNTDRLVQYFSWRNTDITNHGSDKKKISGLIVKNLKTTTCPWHS